VIFPGNAVEHFSAPLFVAWQLTNRCTGRCPACCEESGPDKGWADELTAGEAVDVAQRLADAGIPYVAFGGGDPMQVPHVWDVLRTLSGRGVSLKIETDGRVLDDAAADALAELRIDNIQISIDGASAATHARMRPGSASFDQACAAVRRLRARDLPTEVVYVPTRLNLHEAAATYDLAAELGASAFVTGPLMRLGRAAEAWSALAPEPAEWDAAAQALRTRAAAHDAAAPRLNIYPWDIEAEIQQRLESPQAMILIVPNGRVKLLNALPFAPGDLRTQSLEDAWHAYQRAWRSQTVADFIARCRDNPELLQHANETWPVPEVETA